MSDDNNKNVRARILDAAVELLRKSGVKKLAQPQVAREAGVPQGHLTYYFPRKVDLLLAVAERFVEIVQKEMEELRATGTDGVAPRNTGIAFAREAVIDRERTRMLLGLVTEADNEEAVIEPVARGAKLMRTMVARAIDRHPEDPDTWLTLALFWGLGVQQLLFPQRSTEQVEALIERFEQWLEATKQGEDGDLRRSGTVLKKQVG
ncbi:MAG: TetR/AcrR family transcriptional regulator [Myxococcales bacterium]|nr:TetR/AcrR family transcriptional regulator [Myxococcales bacterium]